MRAPSVRPMSVRCPETLVFWPQAVFNLPTYPRMPRAMAPAVAVLPPCEPEACEDAAVGPAEDAEARLLPPGVEAAVGATVGPHVSRAARECRTTDVNRRPMTDDDRWTMDGRTTDDGQRTTDDERSTTDDRLPTPDARPTNRRPAAGGQPTTADG